ncbi:methanethiol S-methyltransferase [Desulfopila aestuarii]|uniref:methanethiol S-methyltransferase n=1 Tax=Desulfopila aestuarii DSM 18488 TaxID=1121416 RepID=A0A1M7XXR4_9BACT|nr:methanethiol S-methyltransferase [Desulfopila aestuarii]SHO43509.1 Protein-S-isoprenylcysteine O-methyltransferase Ste14 [Desulfopila aestuarii DSM 18488]
MNRTLSFCYGLVCYAVFLISFLYAIGFVGDFVVPKSINSGSQSSILHSLIINLVLLSLFAVQHTIMARPAFKRWWTKIVPIQVERSTFVLVASLILLLLYWQWQPMPSVVWSIENPVGKTLCLALFWIGWLVVLLSTIMINHFDLFGLRQVWLHFSNQDYHHVEFQTNSLYRYVRHPIMFGFIIAFWATPYMTVGHLLFAFATTAYIFIGVQFEEHDLMQFLGKNYDDYRRRVPMLIPFMKKRNDREMR